MKINLEKMIRVKMTDKITPNIRMEEFDVLVDALAEARDIVDTSENDEYMADQFKLWLSKWFPEGDK